MNPQPAPLGSLARQVARSQDRLLADLDLIPGARQEFVKRAAPGPLPRSRVLAVYALAGAMLALGLLLVVLKLNRQLRFETQALQPSADDPLSLHAAASGGGRVSFSDGSTVAMEPASTLRVEAVTSRGASVRLDGGALQAAIEHRASARWDFHAGPFDIAVLGTRFDLRWDPRTSSLAMKVIEGSVQVSGCAMAVGVVSAGQSTELRCTEGRTVFLLPQTRSGNSETASSDNHSETATISSALSNAQAEPASRPEVAASPSAKVEVAVDPAASDWRLSIAQGRLREAFAAADRAGFEQVCASANGRELLDLADAALLSGRTDNGKQALMLVRKKSGGSSASATAGYKLGRIAFDQGSMSEARGWFQSYLQEAPAGPLAREALGRLMEIDVRAGNMVNARETAREYLRRHPDGPQAKLAKELVRP
jgi:TolA-binding protein